MRRPFPAALVVAGLLVPGPARALEFSEMLRRSPIITINRSPAGAFESVTVVALINAPFDQVWQAILDIDAYRGYMKRVEESRVLERSPDGREITARFEIEVPLSNTKYTLRFTSDRGKRTIDVRQVKGDLRGSWWQWRFEPRDGVTYVIYSGRLMSFSGIIERMDDDEKTISLGINISSLLATVKAIRERSEHLASKLPRRPAAAPPAATTAGAPASSAPPPAATPARPAPAPR